MLEQISPQTSEIEPTPLIDSLKLGRLVGSGGNNDVFEIEGNSRYIARVFRSKWDGNLPMITDLKQAIDTVPTAVNVARITSVGTLGDGRVIAVMERAPGLPVHNRYARYDQWHTQIASLSLVSPQHYSKLVEDRDTLFDHGLTIDPSKPDNIFYDPNLGFTYIDLSTTAKGSEVPNWLVVPLLDTAAFYNRLRRKLTTEDLDHINKIISLLRQAGEIIDDVRVEEIMRFASDSE